MDSSTAASDADASSGPAEEPTAGEAPARSFRDAEKPLDALTRGCVAEYSDATCGDLKEVHGDRCYHAEIDRRNRLRPRAEDVIEVYAYDDQQQQECAKQACCPTVGEKTVSCWKACQVDAAPQAGYCDEMPVCAEDDKVQYGCEKVPCFGAQVVSAKCFCRSAPSSKDSDGYDPETRGCVTKYAEAKCGGATTYETERCGVDSVTEIWARSYDLGEARDAGECGTMWFDQVDCVGPCQAKGHKSGTCEEAMIACGPGMMMAGKCVCTD
jgi:hypothetical protein